mmetsp:Transcript_25713/g.42450  ORF Transcript_25713/g.42450 Transcript_25713/m.42450 type:complete len:351 (-) Transcript_25713:68-1120(-)
MFKFDFASSTGSADHAGDSENDKKAEADRMIAKMAERARMSANSCKLLNTSSASTDKVKSCVPERVDLHSSSIDGLHYYFLPQHTELSEKNTDLIPGEYEGGLKVWECSLDLCRFLAHIMDESTVSDCQNVTEAVRRSIGNGGSAFELGCGHGLPACLLLRESVRRHTDSVVVFSDFNDFVLRDVTIPNALLNVCCSLYSQQDNDSVVDDASQVLLRQSIFAGGDWMGLSRKLSQNEVLLPASQSEKRVVHERFDVILASETTYTTESCQDTAYLMSEHLKVDIGVGLVATKRFYFGVGGGADAFSQAADKVSESQSPGLRLVVKTIQSYDTGNANIRDLLEVRLVKSNQ